MTALIDAVRANDLVAVNSLLAGGADVEDMGLTGDTPLVEAAARGYLTVAAALIENGARITDPRRVDCVLMLELVRAQAQERDTSAAVAVNPVVAAALNGHVETVAFLEAKLPPLPGGGSRWIQLRHARHVAEKKSPGTH